MSAAAGSSGSRGTRARAERLAARSGGGTARGPGGAVPPGAGDDDRSTDRDEPSDQASAAGRPTDAAEAPAPDPAARQLGPDELAALEEQRDFLLTSLRDLEAEHSAGDVDDADYASLEDDYTARAADAIRAIEGHHALMASKGRRTSWTKRLLALAAVAVLAIGAGVYVAHSSGTRGAGETATGGTRQSSRDLLLKARQLQAQGQNLEAIKIYDQVLADDPADVEALTWRGWLLVLVSRCTPAGQDRQLLQNQALDYLHRALAVSPTDGTALVFQGVLLGDLGQPAQALASLDAAPAGSIPDFMSGTVDGFRQEMKDAVASGVPSTTGACSSTVSGGSTGGG